MHSTKFHKHYQLLEALRTKQAGAEGIEPPLTVLETAVLPFNYAPKCSYYTLNDSVLKKRGIYSNIYYRLHIQITII